MDTRIVSSRGTDPGAIPVTLEVNGAAVSLSVAPYVTLLDLLREQLQLTGTKKGCDHGQCGACTVLVDGKPINSCLKLAVTADGARVTTIEGLAADGQLDALQRAFIEHDAFQCGYCTPGQVCSARALIARFTIFCASWSRRAKRWMRTMSSGILPCCAWSWRTNFPRRK